MLGKNSTVRTEPTPDQKETSSETTKTVNLHVRLTQIIFERVPSRWSSDSEGAMQYAVIPVCIDKL